MGNSTLPLGGGDATRISEIIIQLGHTFVAGDVVRADETTPAEFVLAQADTVENAEAVGIVESVAGSSFEVVYQGRVDLQGVAALSLTDTPPDGWADLRPTGGSAFSAEGEVWFLSGDVAGDLTRTPPSAAGTVIKAMLVVTDATVGAESGILTGYVGVQIGGESLVNLNDIQPTGSILPWAAPAGSPVPNGWLLCDGSTLDKADFPELFDVIINTYGNADPLFDLPDLRGRAAIGLGGFDAGVLDVTRNAAGVAGGEENHILDADEEVSHRHGFESLVNAITNLGTGTHNPLVVTGSSGAAGPFDEGTPEPDPVGGEPHNNMQPFLVLNFIIRATSQASAAILEHGIGGHVDVDPDASPIGLPSDPDDCDVLKFNATPDFPDFPNGKWEAAPAPGGGAASTAVFSFRNQLINGRFDVWQRGTSFTFGGTYFDNSLFFTPGFGDYTADRWGCGGEPGNFGVTTTNVNRVASNPGDTFDGVTSIPRYFLDMENFVVGGDGTESASLFQRLEGVRTFEGETVTVSFWINGNGTAGTLGVNFAQNFGTGGGASANVEAVGQEFTVDSSGNWQYITLTFAIPSITGKTIGTSGTDKITFQIFLGLGPSVFAGAGMPNALDYQGTMSVSNLQVELGSVATAFEIRELETEVGLCQRYFSKAHDLDTAPFNMGAVPGPVDASQAGTPGVWETHAAPAQTGNGNVSTMLFPVRMRSAPSLLVVRVTPSSGVAGQTLVVNFVGEGSAAWRTQNSIQAILWTADSEL